MKPYKIGNLRNVAVLGHSGHGKTSLVESILYQTKAIDRLGKVTDGNTVSDFDAEEIKRKISISASVIPAEYEGVKINLLDTPGYFDFVGEVNEAIRVSDAAVIIVDAKANVGVGTEKAWKAAKNLPKCVFINKIDDENAHYSQVIDKLRETFGTCVCPIIVPIFDGDKINGFVDCVAMKGRKFEKGAVTDIPIPEGMDDKISPVRTMIMESVAETSEELLDKYLSGEEFTPDEIVTALKEGVKNLSIVPVICGSAFTGLGVKALLNNIINYFPSPDEIGEAKAIAGGEEVLVAPNADDPLSMFIFKTVADQFVGKMSFFRVMSGTITSDSSVINSRTGNTEKIGKIFLTRGKKQIEMESLSAGDIGVVAKLAGTNTGDTLCASSRILSYEGIKFPSPTLSLVILPKAKGDEEKISGGLTRLSEEDPTFTTEINSETHQHIISGQGDMHIDIIVSKLKNKFGIGVDLTEPKVPYRETLRKKVKVEGKHKKQSGGHGQYGHVWIEFEPGETEDLIFEEKVFGGAVPKNYFPAVEKGLRECINKGVLAGYPVVNLKATLVDGSYHPVDSSEMAFKIAASLAFKNGLAQASPVLLEPIGKLNVHISEEYMGDIIGDINKRRGQVLGMNTDEEGLNIVEAEVPMAEMHSYTIDLRSMSRGRGRFSFEFERYQEAPPAVAQKVIEDAKAEGELTE